jgi:hypothetical protein
MKPKFPDVAVGDVVTRMLAGVVPMRLTVTEVTEDRIICGGGWEFDRATGAEIDDDLGWGPAYGATGSYLTAIERPT